MSPMGDFCHILGAPNGCSEESGYTNFNTLILVVDVEVRRENDLA